MPACEERENIAIAVYDGLEFTFCLSYERKIEDSYGQAYDITGENYPFAGIKIGMSKKEVLDKGYNIIRIPTKEEQIKSDSYKGESICYKEESVLKLLHQLKPDNYYKDYNECVYIGRDGIHDDLETFGLNIGAVVLFKNNVVDRIVIGYPTAD